MDFGKLYGKSENEIRILHCVTNYFHTILIYLKKIKLVKGKTIPDTSV